MAIPPEDPPGHLAWRQQPARNMIFTNNVSQFLIQTIYGIGVKNTSPQCLRKKTWQEMVW